MVDPTAEVEAGTKTKIVKVETQQPETVVKDAMRLCCPP
jgi:hypothetical protein